MTTDTEEKLVGELRRISILLALSITRGESQRNQIELLASAGFQAKEIAEILRTSANTVRVTLSRNRKSRRVEMPID